MDGRGGSRTIQRGEEFGVFRKLWSKLAPKTKSKHLTKFQWLVDSLHPQEREKRVGIPNDTAHKI